MWKNKTRMEPPQIPSNGDQVYAYPIRERRVFQKAVIKDKISGDEALNRTLKLQ